MSIGVRWTALRIFGTAHYTCDLGNIGHRICGNKHRKFYAVKVSVFDGSIDQDVQIKFIFSNSSNLFWMTAWLIPLQFYQNRVNGETANITPDALWTSYVIFNSHKNNERPTNICLFVHKIIRGRSAMHDTYCPNDCVLLRIAVMHKNALKLLNHQIVEIKFCIAVLHICCQTMHLHD